MSKTDSLLNLSPLEIVASKKVASKRDISDVNLIVGWGLFACPKDWLTTYLLVWKKEIMSSMLRFQTSTFI